MIDSILVLSNLKRLEIDGNQARVIDSITGAAGSWHQFAIESPASVKAASDPHLRGFIIRFHDGTYRRGIVSDLSITYGKRRFPEQDVNG